MKKKNKKFILLLGLFLAAFLLPGKALAAGLDVKPITWDVVGLDSSAPKVPTGPHLFPVGAEICNTSGADMTDLRTNFVWDSSNPYINISGGDTTDNIGFLAAGDCIDSFYVADITRSTDAWNTARKYRIEAEATGASGETPAGRQLYVERLVGQNRNETQAISGAGGCNADFSVCDPAPTDLEVGKTYTYKLYAETSAPHEQLTSFITFPGSIFQVERVQSTYELPPSATVSSPYADACGWQPDPDLPDYLTCTGPIPAAFQPDGKAGGRMVTTYTVKIIGDGQGSLTSLINDLSGSSYHYNNDFGGINIDFQAKYPLDVTVTGDGSVTSSPTGIDCGTGAADCNASFDKGTEVTLTATPGSGHTFLGWGGACASFGTDPTCTVLMNEAQSATATFSGESVSYPLNVSVTPGGDVESNVGGIDCPEVLCDQSYPEGTEVILTPTPRPGYTFLGWEGACAAFTEVCTLTMDSAKETRALFQAEQPVFHTLLFKDDPNGLATSTSNPAQTGQINCGIECLATYPEGTEVTIKAEALPGFKLVSWGDDCSGTPANEDCVLSMTEDRVASAVYEKEEPITYDLLFLANAAGVGTSTSNPTQTEQINCGTECLATYPEGTQVTIKVEALAGFKVVAWGDDCAGTPVTADCVLEMNEDHVASALYEPIPNPTFWPLNVAIEGQGTVQGSEIDCPGFCQESYLEGTTITLTAAAAPGWKFQGWSGDCTPAGKTCQAEMDRARSVKAIFVLQDPRLKITIQALKEKVYRGSYFRAKVVFRNINRDTALQARPCATLPKGIRIVGLGGGSRQENRVCWPKRDLAPGEGTRRFLLLRGVKTGKKVLRARGAALNAPLVRDQDTMQVIARPKPHPPTG